MEHLSVRNIRKRFPGVVALKGFTFDFQPGRIYGLVGENGAGKSTLVKILMGLYQPDDGEIILNESSIEVTSPIKARLDYKIDAVFQDHPLIPKMNIAENIFLDCLEIYYRRGIARLLENGIRGS
jgi:ABC-type sugar transport system ATPase subunit